MKNSLLCLLIFLLAGTVGAQVTITNDSLGIGTTMPAFQLDVQEIGNSSGDVQIVDNVRIWGSLDVLSGTIFSFGNELHVNDNLRVSLGLEAESGAVIGAVEDLAYDYLQFDVEVLAPPAGDCDDDAEAGRALVADGELYVCLGETLGWQVATLAAP